MKKSSLLTLLFIVTSIVTTSCKNKIVDVAIDDQYNSPLFAKNEYTTWDDRLPKENLGIEVEPANVATSRFDVYYKPTYDYGYDYQYIKDYKSGYTFRDKDKYSYAHDITNYGDLFKLNQVSNNFKQGYLSKLFDGIMFCGGRFQKVRVQVPPSGFGFMFANELKLPPFDPTNFASLPYFALQFKGGSDYMAKGDTGKIEGNAATIDMYVSFYVRLDVSTLQRVTIILKDVQVISDAADFDYFYNFTGFYFDDSLPAILYNQRIVGMSINYDIKGFKKNYYDGYDISFSLLLYEMFLPLFTWY
jgi:hypothetical protein